MTRHVVEQAGADKGFVGPASRKMAPFAARPGR